MAPRQNPLVGLQMDEPTAKYVGMLESTLALHAIQEVKFRTLLELITGDSWEDVKIDYDGKRIQQIAEDALVRSGIDRMQAKLVVLKRWNAANLTTTVPPNAAPLEETAPETITNAEAVITKGDMKSRLQDWKQRNQQAVAAAGAEEAEEAQGAEDGNS